MNVIILFIRGGNLSVSLIFVYLCCHLRWDEIVAYSDVVILKGNSLRLTIVFSILIIFSNGYSALIFIYGKHELII